MRNVNRLCAVAVLIHLGVSLLHGYAHNELKVDLSSWQWYYVLGVITVAPLLGLALLWTKQRRVGLIVLAVSMAGSLIFGAYYHYVFISPDHVSHLPPGDAQGLFRVTAALLAMTELFGFIVALVGYKQIHRFPQITQISK